jgi:Ca-activated chloride channel family protein
MAAMLPALLSLVAFLAAPPAPPSVAPAAPPVPSPTASVPAPRQVDLAIEIHDAKGGTPSQPPAVSDLSVLEDGAPRRVVSIERLGQTPWRFVIYLDRVLATSRTLRAAMGALSAHSAELAALGTVEVVVAEPEPSTVLPATRDPYAIEEALARLAYTGLGMDGVRSVRRRFRDEAAGGAEGAASPAEGGPPAPPAGLAEEAAEEEVRLVRRQADNLASWLAARPALADRPSALLYVADGWDRDPRVFYRSFEKKGAGSSAGNPGELHDGDPLAPFNLETDGPALARTAAALGWTTLPIAVGDAPLPDLRRPLGRGPHGGPAVTLPEHDRERELEKELDKKEQQRESALLLHPLDPLREIAQASGGELLESPLALSDAIARLRGRFLLRYEAAPATDGQARTVVVRTLSPTSPKSPALTLHTRTLVAAGLPAEVSALRARRLLTGEEGRGDLPLSADLRIEAGGPTGHQAQVEIHLSPAALPAGSLPTGAVLRLTAAAPEGTIGSRLLQQPLLAAPPPTAPATPAGSPDTEPWTYHATVPLPEGADRLAVVVDLPASGLWGGELAAVVTGEAGEEPAANASGASGAANAAVPLPEVVRFLQPGSEPLTGRVKVAARVSGADVARVLFKLDGREAATKKGAPWEAEVNLGRAVRPHTLEVLAYAADGAELGRDSLRLNRPGERPGGAHLRIVQPSSAKAGGWVDVEAEVRVPAERRIERVEFFWNEELGATLYQPPYRHRVLVPPNRPGYLRVAARLDDGTTVEDAVPMNTAGATERVDVQLVQLFVVVTDRTGKPVKGLTKDDFRVREEGREQTLSSFDDASEFPITVGLAVDTSASMFVKLPGVVKAAQSLVRTGLTRRDSALLVGFDEHPRLVMQPTRDRVAVAAALDTLHPDGGTGLWGAVDFSISQLQGVSGRRALIVYSDGIEEEEDVSFSTCLRRARDSGIPVYLIFTNAAAAHEGRLLGRLYTGRLERLAAAAGGKLYFVEPDQDLGVVYNEILAELRSQYVLTYYPRQGGGDAFREIKVDVKKSGLKARTISGYYPEF